MSFLRYLSANFYLCTSPPPSVCCISSMSNPLPCHIQSSFHPQPRVPSSSRDASVLSPCIVHGPCSRNKLRIQLPVVRLIKDARLQISKTCTRTNHDMVCFSSTTSWCMYLGFRFTYQVPINLVACFLSS